MNWDFWKIGDLLLTVAWLTLWFALIILAAAVAIGAYFAVAMWV